MMCCFTVMSHEKFGYFGRVTDKPIVWKEGVSNFLFSSFLRRQRSCWNIILPKDELSLTFTNTFYLQDNVLKLTNNSVHWFMSILCSSGLSSLRKISVSFTLICKLFATSPPLLNLWKILHEGICSRRPALDRQEGHSPGEDHGSWKHFANYSLWFETFGDFFWRWPSKNSNIRLDGSKGYFNFNNGVTIVEQHWHLHFILFQFLHFAIQWWYHPCTTF